jgi:ArsR family transcriptional regulator, virulence genes transcriptional regulator
MDLSAAEMERTAAVAADFLKSLANRHRLLVLCHLCEGEKSVGELERLLGVRQPHLSQQLARLREDGLVATRRDARTIYYRLGSPEAERLVGVLHELFCEGPSRRPARRTRPAALSTRAERAPAPRSASPRNSPRPDSR